MHSTCLLSHPGAIVIKKWLIPLTALTLPSPSIDIGTTQKTVAYAHCVYIHSWREQMKVSSITGNSLEPDFIADHHGKSLLDAAQNFAAPLLKIANRIGSSIALGERGDLDAAHEFRIKELGEK
jgi:hypothetical protein